MQRSLRNLDPKSNANSNELSDGDAFRRPVVDTLLESDEQPEFVTNGRAFELSFPEPDNSTVSGAIFCTFAYAHIESQRITDEPAEQFSIG